MTARVIKPTAPAVKACIPAVAGKEVLKAERPDLTEGSWDRDQATNTHG